MELPISFHIQYTNYFELCDNLILLIKYFKENFTSGLKIKWDPFRTDIFEFTISKQYYKLIIPNYEIMTNYKVSFKITILNLDLKNNQALLQFDKINNKKITTKYIYLGRLKRNLKNSIYIYPLLTNKDILNFNKIQKEINSKISKYSKAISKNIFLTVPKEIRIPYFLQRVLKTFNSKLYKKCNCRTIYYDGTFTDHSLSSRQAYSVIYTRQRVILEGKIYRNKEITLGGTSFIVEYYVELQTNRHFVFGNIEGGDGLFNTKFSNDWYELIFDNIFRNELNVFSNHN